MGAALRQRNAPNGHVGVPQCDDETVAPTFMHAFARTRRRQVNLRHTVYRIRTVQGLLRLLTERKEKRCPSTAMFLVRMKSAGLQSSGL